MSKIDLSKVIDPKAKTSPGLVHKFKNTLIAIAIIVVLFGAIIMLISAKIEEGTILEGSLNEKTETIEFNIKQVEKVKS